MPVEPSKVEQAWNRLVDKYPEANVLEWKHQPRQWQDAFIHAINEYGVTENHHTALMVFTNAIRG